VKHRRVVGFAGTTIAVDAEGPAAWSLVQFLFRDMAEAASVADLSFEIGPGSAAGTLRLTQGGQILNAQDGPGAIGAHLTSDAARQIAERTSGGLLLHSAAVAWNGRAVVLPGASGAGKTTLCAHLVQRGLSYLTDELAMMSFREDAAATVEGFCRPMAIKPGAWPSLEIDLATDADAGDSLVTSDGYFVRPERLNSSAVRTATVHAFVFPRRAPREAAALRRLTKAEAALALLANLVNARNLPEHGLALVTRLAKTIPAFEAVYTDAREMAPAVHDIVR